MGGRHSGPPLDHGLAIHSVSAYKKTADLRRFLEDLTGQLSDLPNELRELLGMA
jgi:hypothetical protein